MAVTEANPNTVVILSEIEEIYEEGCEQIDNIKAEQLFLKVINFNSEAEESIKCKENAILKVGNIYAKENNVKGLTQLLEIVKPFFSVIPKARTAKIVRTIIELVAKVPDTTSLQIQLCLDCIAWARAEKRTFLRQRIQSKLGYLYLQTSRFQDALSLINPLLREVKKLEDKPLLVELHLLESHIYFALRNIARSKASLTSARTCANSIYCPPSQQTLLDIQSGILHAEEKDYKTAYSYFYEAFESYTTTEEVDKGIKCLKHMLLCKIMMNSSEDVQAIVSGKLAVKYAGRDVDAMRAVSKAYTERSLKSLEATLITYHDELRNDPVIEFHLTDLKENLLEQNLCRLIEPFSKVQINHIAKLIELPIDVVERKLSQMILDKLFRGILDQGSGCLVVFGDPEVDELYTTTTATIQSMSKVLDSLLQRAKSLS
jgi:26S proteasome regulatory subunit N6